MKLMKLDIVLSALIFLCMASSSTVADWEIDAAQSSLYFVSTKQAGIAEVNEFSNLQGKIDANGRATIVIDLATVETAIDIRNQRIKKLLFNIVKFPVASISTDIDIDMLNSLSIGDHQFYKLKAQLTLHGVSKSMDLEVKVVKLANQGISVEAIRPILLNANEFELTAGIEKLREIAGLNSISGMIPVTFSLIYSQK